MNTQTNNKSTMIVMVVAIIALLAIVAYAIGNAPDRRSTGERVSDAFNELGDGVGDATKQLQDRTPAQKAGDAIEDAGEKIQR